MDKTQTPPGRDGGSEDAGKKEYYGKPVKAKDFAKHSEEELNKAMDKNKARKMYELADQLSKVDTSKLNEQQVAERTAMIKRLGEELKAMKGVAEAADNVDERATENTAYRFVDMLANTDVGRTARNLMHQGKLGKRQNNYVTITPQGTAQFSIPFQVMGSDDQAVANSKNYKSLNNLFMQLMWPKRQKEGWFVSQPRTTQQGSADEQGFTIHTFDFTMYKPAGGQGVAEGFKGPEQEAKVRARLKQLEDSDPDNMYKIVADEFDMSEEELRDALYDEKGVAEGIEDMIATGHKIIANRQTPKGTFVLLQNKNTGQYEIHKYRYDPRGVWNYEFISVHNTPEELQAGWKKLTGLDEGNNEDMNEAGEENLHTSYNVVKLGGALNVDPRGLRMAIARGMQGNPTRTDMMTLSNAFLNLLKNSDDNAIQQFANLVKSGNPNAAGGKEVPQESTAAIAERNAFVDAMRQVKKGEKFKVGDKEFTKTTTHGEEKVDEAISTEAYDRLKRVFDFSNFKG